MSGTSFSATVADWCVRVEGAQETIFKEACRELVDQLNLLVPVGETGFLRSSLLASTTEMPVLDRKNPGVPAQQDFAQIELVINSAELGDVVFLGYSAVYGGYVHYGARGRAPRPWVDMVAQRWQMIVDEVAARVKSQMGL